MRTVNAPVIAIVVFGLGSAVVGVYGLTALGLCWAWNLALPALVPGVSRLTFWPALGILVAIRILGSVFRGQGRQE